MDNLKDCNSVAQITKRLEKLLTGNISGARISEKQGFDKLMDPKYPDKILERKPNGTYTITIEINGGAKDKVL